jgi:hypothetical protein
MWCDNPKCKKEVDINSVAVNKPRGALSMDIEGDVTPTMIHSTSNIINICKSCGESDYLFDSKASAKREDERQEVQRKKDAVNAEKNEKVWGTGCLISLGMGLAFGIWAAVTYPDKALYGFFYIGLCGMMFGVAGTWAVAIAKEK